MKRNSKALLIVLIMIMCVASMFLVSCGKKYTVTLNGSDLDPVQVAENETYNLPTPTKTGYEFVGWYQTEDFSGDALTTITVTADTTVFAKWEKVYAINLMLDGGQLSSSTIYVKDGANIYNAVKDLVPTKENAQFDAWMMTSTTALNDVQTIKGADVTLTARYKYKYTVLAYEEKLDGTYEEIEGSVGYAYKDAVVTPTLTAREGFELAQHADAVTQVIIREDASRNVCKLYFNRKNITITFAMEYPNGNIEEEVVEVKYGETVTAPVQYTATGYHLYAWQNTTATKTLKTNSIAYYVNGTQPTPDSYVPTQDETFYPVWVEGYRDLFGSNDYFFVFEGDTEVCYLVRGTMYFEGSYFADDKEFQVELSGTMLEGAVDTTYNCFYYFDGKRIGTYYDFTNMQFNQLIQMSFDKGNGVTYKVFAQLGGAAQESKGTYEKDGDEYVVKFTSGQLAGQTKYLKLSSVEVTIDGNKADAKVFMFRDETQVTFGRLKRLAMSAENGLQVNDGYYLTFDGYGNAVYEVEVGENQGKAIYRAIAQGNNEYVLAQEREGQLLYAATIKYFREVINGVSTKGFMVRNDNFSENIFVGQNGQELTFDGYYNASYTENGRTTNGTYYLLSTHVLTVAEFRVGNTVRRFSLSLANVMGEEVYSSVELLDSYREYLFAHKDTVYYAPLVAVDSNGSGTASVYGYRSNGQFVKVSDGTYVYDKATGKYTYTQTRAYEYTAAVYDSKDNLLSHGVVENPVKYSLIKSFVFSIDTQTYTYQINYWYSYTDKNDETVDLTKTYETTVIVDEQGTQVTYTLVAVNETAFILSSIGGYNGQGVLYYNYSETIGEGVYVIYFTFDDGEKGLMAIKLNDDGSFFIYNTTPYVYAELMGDGSISTTSFIKFDGVETYTYEITGEDGTKVVYVGKIEKTSDTAPISGAPINVFTGETEDGQKITITFISLSAGKNSYFARYDQTTSGVYYNAKGEGSITLDGCSFKAQYTANANAETVECNYTITEDYEVCIIFSNNTGIYARLNLDTKEYTLRGSEYGDYLLIDNGSYLKKILRIDGYGKVEVAIEGREDAIFGTYTMSNGRCIVTYTDGGTTYTYEGKLSSYSTGGTRYNALLVYRQEYVMNLIDDNTGISIAVDSYGAVVRYLTDGKAETGNCTILSDTLFYYQSDDASYACIYTYDATTRKASASNYTAFTYYSAELAAINFDKGGIVNFGDGITRFYNVDKATNKAYIHTYDPENAKANSYGFVTEEFGTLGYVVTIDGVEYNRTTGYKINFMRDSATADKYPITISGNKYALETLSFRPGRGETYIVDAVVRIGGTDFNVNVGRQYNAETEKYELYCSYGLLQFVIEVTFNGEEDAKYCIVDMKENAVLYSSSYYYNKYVIEEYRKNGTHEDEVGYIEINGRYDDKGDVITSNISTHFLAGSTVLDANGNVINVQNVQYVRSGTAYVFEYQAADGYTYRFDISVGVSDYSNFYLSYEYSILGVNRLQTLSDEATGYDVVIGRLVAQKLSPAESSAQSAIGSIRVAMIYEEGQLLQTSNLIGGTTSAIVVYREVNQSGWVENTIYFNIECAEEQSALAVKLFASCTITPETIDTIYDEYHEKFIDVRSDNSIMLFYYSDANGAGVYNASSSSYDESTNSYIIMSGNTALMALVSEEGGKKVARVELFTVVKSGTNAVYLDGKGEILLIKYNNKFYRAEGDDYGWNSQAGIYQFMANGKEFVIVKTQNTSVISLKLVEVVYAEQNASNYVAVNANKNEIVFVCYQNRIYVATSQTYNASTKTYTVQTANGTYTVVVDGENTTITQNK